MGFGRPLRPMPPRADAQRVWPEADWWAGPAAPVEEPVRSSSPSVTTDRT